MNLVIGVTSWIDVCQSNANLLVSGGGENSIRIFDKRESKIVKTFEESLYIGKEFHSIFVVIHD